MGVGILGTGHYAPENVVTNKDLEKILSITGKPEQRLYTHGPSQRSAGNSHPPKASVAQQHSSRSQLSGSRYRLHPDRHPAVAQASSVRPHGRYVLAKAVRHRSA